MFHRMVSSENRNAVRHDFPAQRGKAKRKYAVVLTAFILAFAAGATAFLYLSGRLARQPGTAGEANAVGSAVSAVKSQAASAASVSADYTQSPENTRTAVAAEKLNIRAGYGTDYDTVCTVRENTKLKLTGKQSADGTWVKVETPSGKTGWCCRAYLNMEAISVFMFQGLTLPLSLEVSLSQQKVTVLDTKDMVVKTFPCSSGKSGSKTPTGTFAISGRGRSFYNAGIQEGGYYWTRFYGDYLFHSIPFDKNYKVLPAEAAKLGTTASHGCIRLSFADAKWIYDYIPDGTKVEIHN